MAVIGGQELRRKFQVAIPKAVTKAARKALEQGADEYVALMRRLVPADEGKLAASIGWTWGKPPKDSFSIASSAGPNETAITIYAGDSTTIVTNSRGIEFQNAFIQEFGTKKRPASPYFYVTHRTLKKRVRARVTRSITKAIKNG